MPLNSGGRTVEKLLAAGFDTGQIATQLGIERGAVNKRIQRLGLSSNPPAAPRWGDEKIARLKVLWAQGLSASKIADVLGGGTTRNAVIGKTNRLGLVGRKTTTKKKYVRGATSRKGHRTNGGAYRPLATKAQKRAALKRFQQTCRPDQRNPPPEERIGIFQLTNTTCRYPIGDPRDGENFAYCGRKISGPLTYCDDHHAFTHREV